METQNEASKALEIEAMVAAGAAVSHEELQLEQKEGEIEPKTAPRDRDPELPVEILRWLLQQHVIYGNVQQNVKAADYLDRLKAF